MYTNCVQLCNGWKWLVKALYISWKQAEVYHVYSKKYDLFCSTCDDILSCVQLHVLWLDEQLVNWHCNLGVFVCVVTAPMVCT